MDSLVNRPLHGRVRKCKRREHVERLGAEASPGVEDGRVQRVGEGALAVRGDGVGGDAFLRLRA